MDCFYNNLNLNFINSDSYPISARKELNNMSVCPKCGRKLKMVNISQYCPSCGVNLRFYGFEDRFYLEAKQAELAFAQLHIKLNHFKAAFVGNWLMITRLAVSFLPMTSLLIPTAYISLTLPYFKLEKGLSLTGIMAFFSGTFFSYTGQMSNAIVSGGLFSALRVSILAETSVALFAVLNLLLSLLCFISIKHMQKVICFTSVLGLLSAAVSAAVADRFCSATASSDIPILNGSMGFGYIATIACFAVVFTVNLIIDRRGIEAKYEEGDLERAEIAKKVKAGLLKIEDLPQPIVETAATKAIEDEIVKEREAFIEKYGNDTDENP